MKPFFQQQISKDVWDATYKWEDESIFDTFKRIAKAFASNEPKDKELYEAKNYGILTNFKYVPGGRIVSNAGTGLKGTTWINCFVDGFRPTDIDSIDGIMDAISRAAVILKSEGGYGFCASPMRPKGNYIKGTGIETPGAVEMLNMWNQVAATITKGAGKKTHKKKGKNKIRKGAMMATLHCWHPDIEDFIIAKQEPGVLSKFNLSVLITNDFMKAVEKDKDWDLVFPDTTFEKYDSEWDGDINKWNDNNYPVIVHKTIKAKELWDIIMTSTYNRNEPGVIFIDRVNELNNLWSIEKITATNPCGEQPIPQKSSCNLGSINLTQYINEKKTDYDYDQLSKDIPYIVRMQDSVNDLTEFPFEYQKEEAQQKRRVGIGYLGYGSSLYLLKIPYGSEKALKLTNKLCKFVTNALYNASVDLAIEKGAFPLFDKETYLKSKFIKQALTKETIERIEKYGIRNSHLTTIAPTGNTGIFSNNVSGGLEPVISPSYIRTLIVDNKPDDVKLPKNIEWNRKIYSGDGWDWIKEGDENVLHQVINDTVYKVDRNRGLCREEQVTDYSVQDNDDFNEKDDYVKHIYNLTPKEHIDTMKTFAKYIDSAISKTINLPNDYSYDDFKDIYLDVFKTGFIKGFTTYRWGTTTSVISIEKTKVDERNGSIIESHSPIRPKTLPCDIYKVKVHGESWVVFVSMLHEKPYEVFAGKVDMIELPSKMKEGAIVKVKRGHYQLEHEGELIIRDLNKVFDNQTHEAFTRMVSLSLRHGASIEYILEQLQKSQGSIADFSKSIMRSLKKYSNDEEMTKRVADNKCPSCGDKNLVYIEGCLTCNSCGLAKC